MTDEVKDAEPKKAGPSISYWNTQIAIAERGQREWIEAGRKVVKRYKSDRKSALNRSGKRFNILYSNTEVLRSALYARPAKPDVRRRFSDQDPVGRQAAEIVERALVYCDDSYDGDAQINAAIQDYVLPGRGVVRIAYEPVVGQRPVLDPMTTAPVMGEDGKPVTEEFIQEQKLQEQYVFWEDFLTPPARAWDKLPWIAFRQLMDRSELEEAFPDCTDPPIPLNWSPSGEQKQRDAEEGTKAEVWEIWDKRDRQRLWYVKGYPKICRTDDDPLGLELFFPLPAPPTSYSTNDTILPEPEFHAYQDQADDLDENARRISVLTKALKRRGVYDQSIKELKQLAGAGDNQFIPVINYAALGQKGGLAAAFQSEDLSVLAQVLLQLYQQSDMLIQKIYEVTGMSDIMRGSSDPNETLGAQQLKSQFGSMRLKRRQRGVQQWIRDLYRIKAEIICEHFEPNILQEITQQQVTPEIMQILRSDKMRSYRIDIETDSTILEDAAQEKQARIEAVTAIGAFLEKAIPAVQAQPALMPLMFKMLAFTVRSFKEGQELEDDIEQAQQQLMQAAQQPKPPDPETVKMEQEMKMREADHMMNREEHQMDMQATQAKTQATVIKSQADIKRAEMDMARAMMPQPETVQ